jgi:hypothetical protein
MATRTHQSEHLESALRTFDSSVRRILGVDMRLVYGVLAPAMVVIGLIVVLAFNPSNWLVGAIVVVEIAAVGLVLAGLREMLSASGEPPS